MTKFRGKYRIESNRWRYWDYSKPGRYFLTNCMLGRERILGHIKNGEMILSKYGTIVKNEILNMPGYHRRVILDEWVIMPDHIHLIIELGDYGFDNGLASNIGDTTVSADAVDGGADAAEEIHEFPLLLRSRSGLPWWHNPDYEPTPDEIKQYRKHRRRMIIPLISGKMKMISSKQINLLRKTPGQKNWQHDYNDHVIRNEQAYRRIKQHIIDNPKKWDEGRSRG